MSPSSAHPLDPTGLTRVDLGNVSSFAVMSDVHVRTPDDARALLLVRTLDALHPETSETVFLLGDVFDFIYVGSAFHRGLWSGVFKALRRARERGIRVHFCEGNHDFGFQHSFHAELKDCFDTVGDVVFTLRHPVLGDVWLRHGDDVVCPPGYARFRGIVKSRAFQKSAGVVPGRFTHAFFSSYAKLSRTRDKYRALDPAFFRACLEEHFRQTVAVGLGKPALFVLGHVHVNLDALCAGVRVWAGPDWFQSPHLTLVSAGGACERRWLTPDASARAPEFRL